jgi:hypothetical protein
MKIIMAAGLEPACVAVPLEGGRRFSPPGGGPRSMDRGPLARRDPFPDSRTSSRKRLFGLRGQSLRKVDQNVDRNAPVLHQSLFVDINKT